MSGLDCTKWALVVLWCVAVASSGEAQEDLPRDDNLSSHDTVQTEPSPLRRVENRAFTVGEFLRFGIHFGFLKAGEAVMEIPDVIQVSNRDCYRIRFNVNSVGLFSVIYKVEDRYETCVDVLGLFPWRYEQHIREGGYRRDIEAEFDQFAHIATTKGDEIPIPPYVHDIVSALYFVRTLDFSDSRPGDTLQLQQFYRDTTYSLIVKYRGIQAIEVDAGEFRCIIVEPIVKEGGLFKQSGRIIIWMTDDGRKMPVKVVTKIPIGSVIAELEEYRGLLEPIESSVK